MKNNSGWNDNGNGTNAGGFSALPGRERSYSGDFKGLSYAGYWWSSSEYNSFKSGSRYLMSEVTNVYRGNGQKDGFSVRCVKG